MPLSTRSKRPGSPALSATSGSSEASGRPSRFFACLAEWEHTPRSAGTFEERLNTPIATPQPIFYARLYHLLVDHLLERLRLPRSDGAAEWEWKALYRLGPSLDPFYFTEAQIQELLERWPVIGYARRQIMVSVLSAFFHLRREGFPACYPSPLVPPAELERWMRIFPPEWAWDSARVLRRMGFIPMASLEGYRAFMRFSEGEFDPEPTQMGLRRWWAECWAAGSLAPGVGTEASWPYQANFVAAVFAGRAGAFGIEGPCGSLPDCDHCPLTTDCSWYNTSGGEWREAPEILSQARRGQLEHLRSEALLQGLLGLSAPETVELRERLNGTTLRELAGKSSQELQSEFKFRERLPEQLTALLELCRRFNEERMEVGTAFQTPWDVFKHFRMRLRDLKQEQFIVVLLDTKKRYLSDLVITQGTLTASPVHPREVFTTAIRERAAAVVFVHNHPSGDPQPSREDVHVTQQLIKVGELVGIPVVDHIIIAGDQYISMLEQGLLKD